MAQGMNRTTLIGNLGIHPELRYTQNGNAVLKMRLATTEVYLNRDKEPQERTEWHIVIVWGKRAEALNKILGKGDRICVEGRIQTRSWQTDKGEKRYTTEIVATNILLLGSRKASDTPSIGPGTETESTTADELSSLSDNEMPF